ncbi:MAG TPA: helix-turn-helix transcriptional regulator [Micromonosporaceae bacterium]
MTATTSSRRRDELAQFLRSRRERITPAEVGLPPGLRRRTPGLRREEVAQLAGVGVTWYTWLEQGRAINASVQVLDAIARTLRLDSAERDHLYRLADVPAVPAPANAVLPDEVQTVLDAMVPLPAVVYNGRWDAIAWNATYRALFPGITDAGLGRRNVLWQMFTVPACCSAIGNRDAELRIMVANFRAAFGRHIGEPAWTSFVDALLEASPEFATMWAKHDVAGLAHQVKVFIQNVGEPIHATSMSLAISAAAETRIVVYTPVDDDNRSRLVEITANPPTIRRCAYHEAAAADRAVIAGGS